MKNRIYIFLLLGWLAGFLGCQKNEEPKQTSGRKIKFYQCSMHPQVKSDKPGKCTICGMELSPIFEGETALNENVITLSSNSINVINVQTEEVKRRPLQRTLKVAGNIDDNDTRHQIISAYIDGRVEKLFINAVGAEVKKGEPLATFYSPNLLTAEREYQVLAQRMPTNSAGVLQHEHAKLVEAAAQRLKRLGLNDAQISALEKQTEQTFQTEILSPISGTVVERNVYEGQYVKEGDKLFEVGDFSTMWFMFDAYERDLPWLRIGQIVEVTTPSAPNKIFKAPITFFDPNLKDTSRSARVRVEIKNPLIDVGGQKRRELFHRLYAEGSVKVDLPEVLALPRSAVLNPGGEAMIYVESKTGSYEPRRIELGRMGDEFWEVKNGVTEGERVVTRGNLLIDAQAQLNGSAAPEKISDVQPQKNESSSSTSSDDKQKLNVEQKNAAKDFLAVAAEISQALSSDDLKKYNQLTEQLPAALTIFEKAFSKTPEWERAIEQIEKNARLKSAADLKEARKSFVPFTTATAEFARELRNQEPDFQSFKIYECPMVDAAVPGAPKRGRWLQTSSPLQNPFFGSEMPDCGSEVKP